MIALPLKSHPVTAGSGVRSASLGQRIWHALEAAGQRRAARAVRERAVWYAQSNPGLAAELDAAARYAEHQR